MIMDSPCFCISKLLLVSMLLLLLGPLLGDSYSTPMSCHAEESSALLQFKDSFAIDKLASSHPLASPKVLSWTLHGDCCSWEGVDCDGDGHVIGLDLTSSCLFGSIHSNSSLFNLKHLQKLSLADNNFNYSPIPSELALLSSTLTHLDLSLSNFAGQIPSEISMLSRLVVLDLSINVDPSSSKHLLQLKKPVFTSLVQNLSKLEDLVLSWVDISSTVPNSLSNLSSLSTLYLMSCSLVGEFPSTVFLLPNLEYISVRLNEELTGHLPQFHQSPLKFLKLASTSFSGELPNSIQNLHSLTEFDVRECNFTGPVSSSLGSLTNLTYLDLAFNKFIGPIPSSLGNLTSLTRLHLGYNFLQGSVQKSIFSKLVNLEFLCLSSNNLSGTLGFDMFHDMRNLSVLWLGHNPLSILDDYNGTLVSLQDLQLSSCNLHKFPNFLKHQQNLVWLYLGRNKIHGQVPGWFCNTSKETLLFLDLSGNLLTGLGQCNGAASWVNLEVLDLADNLLRGSLPTPPQSINIYRVSNNTLTGEIPSLSCNLSSLINLDLQLNNLSGKLPRCLSNMSDLSLLLVNDNSFSGTIPHMCTNRASILRGMDLSENHLQGKIPRSLANCTKLRGIDVGGNQINDTFPLWMGNLKGLELLILGSNRFHGPVLHTENNPEFPSLRIIDLSHNRFYGVLPCALFSKWQAMKKSNPIHFAYMQISGSIARTSMYITAFSVTLENKGSELEYEKIPDVFAALDFSSNNFSGKIPQGMGNLNGLYVLNLANNHLSGTIPSSLANMTVLESLDLSNNMLSGEIPQQLAQLSSLAYLNLSHNNLVGQVPRGRQFDTFQDSSFDGNSGLCGELLITKRCSGLAPPPSEPICSENCEDVESSFPSKWDWMVIAMGYVGGLVVGVVIGNAVMANKPEWLVKVFGKKMQPRTKRRKRSHRN